MNSLVEHVINCAEKKRDSIIYTFISDGVEIDVNYEKLHQRAKNAAGYLQVRYDQGDRVILSLKPGLDFVTSFFGCLYAGLVPITLYPPFSQAFIKKIEHVIQDADPKAIITSYDLAEAGRSLGWNYGKLDLLFNEEFSSEWGEAWIQPDISGEDIAFLQYTSGSTNDPKGVIITHENILQNQRLIRKGFSLNPDSIGVGWLPVYHDMGLIGNILQPCYTGYRIVLISPLDFMADPLCWLELISKYRGTMAGGPNFGYDLCARRYDKKRCEKLDLSSWGLAFSGAEPVRGSTIDRFTHLFQPHGFSRKAFLPCYGLAENTLLACCIDKTDMPKELHVLKDVFNEGIIKLSQSSDDKTLGLVCNGVCPPGQTLKIVDPQSHRALPEDQIGEIWLQGGSAARGYWHRGDLSRETFQAHTEAGEGPFLRTGDLGFLHEGELYIAGRIKDLIIIRGRNYYPQDIELTVEQAIQTIRPGRVAAFLVEEKLCVLAEYGGDPEDSQAAINTIIRSVKQDHELNVAHVCLVTPKSLPVTTSGKIRRRAAKQRFEDESLAVIERFSALEWTITPGREPVSYEDLTYSLLSTLSRFFGLAPDDIDPDLPFGHYGLTSSEAVELTDELEKITRRPCSPTLFYDYPTLNLLLDYLTGITEKMSESPSQDLKARRAYRSDIAIVGMACRFPSATDPDSFWENIEQARDCLKDFPDDVRKHILCRAAGSFARRGGFIEDIDAFDAAFFSISPKEARLMDPQQRLFLQTAWHCLEHAGYAPGKLSGKDVGVFAGVSAFDYLDVIRESGLEPDAYTATGLAHTMIANRVSYLLNIHGPSEVIDTACSSSLVAIHRAVTSIRQGDCSMALAGGVNVLISSDNFTSLGLSGFLSNRGRCSTFDSSADGYVRGEGCGMVLLKSLDDAERDGDFIHGVIRGTAVSHGGKSESLTAPNASSQARLIMKACNNAGVSPSTIAYVETHGTGTVLGDPIEVNGLISAFHDMNTATRSDVTEATCALGSVKSNIGHLESAAGIAGLIKVVEAMKRKIIPPNVHVDNTNPLIQLANTPFYIPKEKKVWPVIRDSEGLEIPARAGISSFGFGGTYAHMVLETYENNRVGKQSGEQLFVFSSKNRERLDALLDRYLEWLSEPKNHQMVSQFFYDTACTLAEGRDHLGVRFACVSSDVANLIQAVQSFRETGYGDAHSFFGSCMKNRSGQLCFEHDLRAAAQRWVLGDDLDWVGIRKGQEFKKIPLPGYVFENSRFFAVETKSHVTHSAKLAGDLDGMPDMTPRKFSYEEIERFLFMEVAQMMDVADCTMDSDRQFDAYGLDSMAMISLLNSLEHYTGMAMPSSAIQDYTTIGRLARFVADGLIEESPKPDLIPDTELDEFLFIRSTPKAKSQGKSILLTGSTGYLGSYLLGELLEKTEAQIYCLVRAENENMGLDRVKQAARNFGTGRDIPDHRIHIIPGDLSQWRLGLERQEFNRLSGLIDTIWHCGATVDWMKPYDALKNTNVEGTREIIRMAAHKTIKTLHFVSSLAVLPLIAGQNEWYEREVSDPTGISGGYGQSKWVAEQLCLKAAKWGVPVSVYRFDYVAGKPGSGVMKQSDFIARLIKGCIQLGSMPLEETNFDIIPVDYLCSMMVAIAGAEPSSGKIYHLLNRKPFSTSDFATLIRKRGHKIHRIPFEQWKHLTKKDPKNVLFPLYPFINRYDTESFEAYTSWKVDNTQAMTALFQADQELIRNIPGADQVLESVMDYLTDCGYLPKGVFAQMFDRHVEYWAKQLKDAPVHTPLPSLGRQSRKKMNNSGEYSFSFAREAVTALAETERSQGMDPMVLIVCQVFVLLSRYSRQDDLLLAVRKKEEIHPSASRFIRCPCSSQTTLGTLALYVGHLLDQAWTHRDMPQDILETMLGIESDGDYPLQLNWGGKADDRPTPYRSSLCFEFFPEPEGLSGRIVYDRSVHDAVLIKQMTVHLDTLVQGMVEHWDKALACQPMLTNHERDELIHQMNRTEMDYPNTLCVHQLFARMALKQPMATAVIHENSRMTYRELNDRSDLLSVYLHDRGLVKGQVVGLCVERSMAMMVSVLGILKTGAAYLPLDPDYPQDRLAHMISDAGVGLILCSRSLKNYIPDGEWDIIVLDDVEANIQAMGHRTNFAQCVEALDLSADPHDLAYIIYTSGSTGQPKGVRAMHKGLVNLVFGMDSSLNFTMDDTMLNLTRLSFDMVKPELYLPLLKGGTIHIISQDVARDGFLLKNFLENNRISVMQATPSSWRLLVYAGWTGSPEMTMITGGEPLPDDLAAILARKGKQLLNFYGPTETTVWSTVGQIDSESGVHMGYPLANTRLYVLDPDMNPVPKGVPGELYIGGHGVTQGYHRRPDLTRERYLVNPFVDEPETMYRTGDLVRMRQDGALEYIERLDHQVKIRGYRIELKEIEQALIDLPCVKEAVVQSVDDGEGGKSLCAWLVAEPPDQRPDTRLIREQLNGRLPSWMVPAHMVWLGNMPLNHNGKIDVKKLPAWSSNEHQGARVQAGSEMEADLLSMWTAVLGIPGLGVTDNFMESGGDSLKAMKLLVEINERFGIELTVQKLFENLTIQKLANTIERLLRGEDIVDHEIAGKMQADAVLDTDIIENSPDIIQPDGEFLNVFLTGATGYLGAYLLRDLMEQTASVVFCLVRSRNREDGFHRLKSNLEKFGVWKQDYTDRIVPLSGDLAQKHFGLEEEIYQSVAGLVDAVFHNGAMVNFSYSYDLLKKANVTGTREVLEFTACERIKPLYYVSTIGVFETRVPLAHGSVGDDHPLPEPDQLYYGYAQSKWVAEKLVTAYRDQGMPVTIFRPGPIYGNRINGALNTDDFFCRMIRACVQLGAMPQLDVYLDGVAVDQVSRAIVDIARKPETVGSQVNIVNPKPVPVDNVFRYLRSYGYDLTSVSVDTWMTLMRKEAQTDSELLPFLPLVTDKMSGTEGRTFFEMQTLGRQRYSCKNLVTILDGTPYRPVSLDEPLFHAYLDYLNDVGYLSGVPELQED